MTHVATNAHCIPKRRSGQGFLQSLVALSRQRRDLKRLDDRALADIGVSREDAIAEANRPVWDAPEHWYKSLF